MNIVEIITHHLKERGDQIAIIDTVRGQRRHISYAELDSRSAQTAALLRKRGLKPGAAVLVFQPMSAELYVILLALFRAGLVAMFLDPAHGKEHIDQCCAIYQPQGFVGTPKAHLLRLRSAALRAIPIRFSSGRAVPGGQSLHRAADLPPTFAIEAASSETAALLTFTSGSTGQPKAALRSHGFLRTQHQVLTDSLALVPGEVTLTTMPIVALANLASGMTCLIPNVDLRHPGKIKPATVIRQIQTEQIVSAVASPAFWQRVAEHAAAHGLTLPKIQRVYTGGAPVFPQLLQRLHQAMPNAEVTAIYGSTEAEPMAELTYNDLQPEDFRAMQSGAGLLAGKPVSSIELRVIRAQWGTPIAQLTPSELVGLSCAVGEAGEIVVSGAHVLRSYLDGQGDEETKFFVDDTIWHRTGDMGYLDQVGRLWLLGRCSACIRDADGELYPLAVECLLQNEPSIHRSTVVGHRGKRTVVVEFEERQTADLSQLRQKLAWAQIHEVRSCAKIPVDKRHNSKIDYPALHVMLDSR